MSSLPWSFPTYRGTSQPEQPPIEALQCETCTGWWLPGPDEFGCPHCARTQELLEHQP